MTTCVWLRCSVALLVACSNNGDALKRGDAEQAPYHQSFPPIVEFDTNCRDNPSSGWCRNALLPFEPRDARAELPRAAAMDVLASHCAVCHSRLAQPQPRPAPDAIDDLDALVRSGDLVPLNSPASRVFQVSASGQMPPRVSGLSTLAQADLDLLALLIDTPSFWPQSAPLPSCTVAPSFLDFDALFRSVASDLATLPSSDQSFYRYISLTNRSNAVCSESELDGDRRALIKGLNMLSLNASVQVPIAIDDAARIYRIDLRNFDWAHGIDVKGNSLHDVWEAIAGESPYSVEFTGDAAALAKAATGTAFPILFADHLLDQALGGELYYAILGIRSGETWTDFQSRALADPGYDFESGLVQRAGTSVSRVTQDDRLVQREDLGSQGVLWQAFDCSAVADQTVFEDPLSARCKRRTQAIFTLPNGLFAFIGVGADDSLVSDPEVLFDSLDYSLPSPTPVSCSACHASGLIPVVDQVKDIASANASYLGLNAGDVAQLERVYPDPPVFAELVARDSSPYQQALNQLRLPSSGSDPVAGASLRFGAPLTLRDAAGELGLRPDALAGSLSRVPWLSPLGSDRMSRDAFAAVYVASLCVVSEPLANRPDQATCDRAARGLRSP